MLTFVFPGQGSQAPAMGSAWTSHPSWELVDEASDACGRDVAALLVDADADELRHTHNAQLATFVLSMVALDATERTGVAPAFVAGHSLGEYSALCAVGVLSYPDAVKLVAERGEAMGEATQAKHGTMAAVLGLDDDQVLAACEQTQGDVWVANYNAPGQVVIAGDPEAVDAAGGAAKELGAKRAMGLNVAGAFHTPYMSSASERLAGALGDVDIRAPSVGVVANVDAQMHDDARSWVTLLTEQLTSPVRWRASLHALSDAGATAFVELGPGAVLTGTVKRTLADATQLAVNAPSDIDKLLSAISEMASVGPAAVGGEGLYVTERVIVSPCAGLFEANSELAAGDDVAVGAVVGWVAGEEVRSPFAGTVMGVMAVDGERVTARQSVAWLRSQDG